jgi:hypothetical protein
MENVAKGSDGCRLFTAEFKHSQIDRVLKGEITVSCQREWDRAGCGSDYRGS